MTLPVAPGPAMLDLARGFDWRMQMQANGYSRVQIVLHWLIMGMMAAQFLLAEAMSEVFEDRIELGAAELDGAAGAHAIVGLAVLALMIWRISIRLRLGPAAAPAGDPAWQHAAAVAVHWALYALAVLLPVTGALAWNLGSEAMGEAHEVLRGLFLLVLLIHVLGALFGQYVRRNGVMVRMKTPGR